MFRCEFQAQQKVFHPLTLFLYLQLEIVIVFIVPVVIPHIPCLVSVSLSYS